MSELIKIRELSVKYDISARALKYYEDMGLISSTRSKDHAYRMYDEAAVKRSIKREPTTKDHWLALFIT